MIGARQSNPLDWNPHKPLGELVRPSKIENGKKALRTVYLYLDRISPNRTYVGQTWEEEVRRKGHDYAPDKSSKFHCRIRELRKQAGKRIPVHELFDYSILIQKEMTQSEANFYERALIFHYNANYPHGYSKRWSGGCSEETRKKIQKSNTGKKASEETRRKLSKSHLNPCIEKRRRMSEAHKGQPGGMLGKHHSEETKAKIREKLKGVPKPKTNKFLQAVKKTLEFNFSD